MPQSVVVPDSERELGQTLGEPLVGNLGPAAVWMLLGAWYEHAQTLNIEYSLPQGSPPCPCSGQGAAPRSRAPKALVFHMTLVSWVLPGVHYSRRVEVSSHCPLKGLLLRHPSVLHPSIRLSMGFPGPLLPCFRGLQQLSPLKQRR